MSAVIDAFLARPAGSSSRAAARPPYRVIRGILFEAHFAPKPAWFGSRPRESSTPRQKLGLRYERRALSALSASAENGAFGRAFIRVQPFIRYRDAVGVAFAEPDAIIESAIDIGDGGFAPLLFEVKLTFDEAHWAQVALYERLLRHILHADAIRSALVVKTLRGAPNAPLFASTKAFAESDAPRGVIHAA